METLKLNIDASITQEVITAAYFIQDCNGLLVRAGGKSISKTTVPDAELIAV